MKLELKRIVRPEQVYDYMRKLPFPHHDEVAFDAWKKAYLDDTDGEGRTLFSDLGTAGAFLGDTLIHQLCIDDFFSTSTDVIHGAHPCHWFTCRTIIGFVFPEFPQLHSARIHNRFDRFVCMRNAGIRPQRSDI